VPSPARGGSGRTPIWAWSLVGVAAITAITLTILATGHGPGVSPDSVVYLSGARNLAGGRGYDSYALQPITEYPFGLSATLGLGAKVGIDPGDGARWLNALAFGALVALTFVLARRHLRHLWLAVGAAVAVAWAAPLMGVFSEAWSEPVFCVLAVALVLVLEQLLADREHALGWLVAAALLASVGFTFRYAGLALLALPVLVIGVATRRDGWRVAVARTLTYLALAAVLPAWVISRNLADGSAVFGPRASSIETLGGVAHSLLVTVRSWTLAGEDVSSALGWVVLVGAVAVVALGVAAAWPDDRRPAAPGAISLVPLVALVGGYVAYLVVSELVTNINAIDTRLLSPVYAPAVVLFLLAVDPLVAGSGRGNQRWLAACFAVMVGVWLVASLAESAARVHQDAEEGQGFASPSWVDSSFVAAYRRLPRDARVYSNYADGLYWATGRQPVNDSPAAVPYRSAGAVSELGAFRQLVRRSREPVYLVWLRPNTRTYLVTPEQLALSGLHLSVRSRAGDTTVYAVRG
jgi:hypothetical protein